MERFGTWRGGGEEGVGRVGIYIYIYSIGINKLQRPKRREGWRKNEKEKKTPPLDV